MTDWHRVENLIEARDGHLTLTIASECCWSGELRLGFTNPANAPARSMTFYSVGGLTPEEVVSRLLADAEAWERGE